MRGLITCLLCTLPSITCSSSSADAAANPLESTKPWDLDYGLTQCTAMRQYGDSDRPVTLAIIPAPNGENYELVVAYKRRPIAGAEEYEGTVTFGSRPISGWALKYGTGDLTLYQFRLSWADMAQARSAPVISFSLNGELEARFKLENMPEIMDGLQKCTADLEDYWNAGGEKNGRIAVPSHGDVRAIFTSNDYPGEAVRRGQRGTAQYMLQVDEKGFVAGCHVLEPSGVPALDAIGCLVIKERSKMTPAKDAAGKAVRSTVVTPRVVWRIAG
jgi:TonB family protein